MAYNFTLPFQLATSSNGYFEVTETVLDSVVSNARSLLVTNWGERPMNYYFGCNLRQFLFEQKTDGLRHSIADRISEQFARWFPFLAIDELNVLFSSDETALGENAMAIRITFRFSKDPSKAATIIQVVNP